jgi:sugar/nucleoside kinase (ribokinase family)
MPPDCLVVGHVCKDLRPGGGWRLGGSVAYASLQASRLGLDTVAVTSCAPDVSPAEAVPSVRWHVVPAMTTTAFENRQEDGHRRQRLLGTATPIEAAHLPPRWQEAPVVLLGPVFHDIDPSLGAGFPAETTVGLAAQGWLRGLDGDSVTPGSVHGDEAWLHGDIVFVSEEDLVAPEEAERWLARVPAVVLTRGHGGSTVWSEGGRIDLPAFASREVDATGAGDVFAASYLVRYAETKDHLTAARFAAAAAALCIGATGLDGVASRAEIEAFLATAGVPTR